MGHCTSDAYKTAKKQYGESFQKFIVQSQTSAKHKEWIRARQQEYDSKLVQKKDTFNKELDQRQQLLFSNFSEAKLNLQSQLPYGISSYQQMVNSTLEQILGFEGYQNKINSVRAQIQIQTNSNKESFHSQAEAVLKSLEQESKIEDERLKTFHDLTEEKRKFIYDKGVKQFEALIANRLKQLEDANSQALSVDQHLESLNTAICLSEIDSMVVESRTRFQEQVTKIVGSNQDSGIRV